MKLWMLLFLISCSSTYRNENGTIPSLVKFPVIKKEMADAPAYTLTADEEKNLKAQGITIEALNYVWDFYPPRKIAQILEDDARTECKARWNDEVVCETESQYCLTEKSMSSRSLTVCKAERYNCLDYPAASREFLSFSEKIKDHDQGLEYLKEYYLTNTKGLAQCRL